jgi:hypothetical protein
MRFQTVPILASAAGVDPRTSPGSVLQQNLVTFQKLNAGDVAPTRFVLAAEGTSGESFVFNLWAMDDSSYPDKALNADDPTAGWAGRKFYKLTATAITLAVGSAASFATVVPQDGTVYVQPVATLPAHDGMIKIALV